MDDTHLHLATVASCNVADFAAFGIEVFGLFEFGARAGT